MKNAIFLPSKVSVIIHAAVMFLHICSITEILLSSAFLWFHQSANLNAITTRRRGSAACSTPWCHVAEVYPVNSAIPCNPDPTQEKLSTKGACQMISFHSWHSVEEALWRRRRWIFCENDAGLKTKHGGLLIWSAKSGSSFFRHFSNGISWWGSSVRS